MKRISAGISALCIVFASGAYGDGTGSHPVVTWVQPANNSQVPAGSSITLQVSASEPGGTIAQVLFTLNNAVIGAASKAPYQIVWTPGPGTYTVTALALDAANSGGSAAIQITVGSGVTVLPGGTPTYNLTVVNGTPTGAYPAGAIVQLTANAPPAGNAFQSWTGFGTANSISSQTTLTMPANNTTVTATYSVPLPVPFPVTTHPRLWITQLDLPRLQTWARPGNVAYQGMQTTLAKAIGNYGQFFPGAALNAMNPTPASPYPDFGDSQGYTGLISEDNAVILAFNSLIDTAHQAAYAQAARNVLMYAMNQAALGQAIGQPFRDPTFPLYNRASFSGHEWALVVDWIYPVLSAADKATIQKVFMTWAADCLTASTTGGDNPGPAGVVNSLALLRGNKPYRMASNNYFLAHARLLTMISLVLDPADDPSVNAAIPSAAIGNSLRSYITDATGAWLYEEFAMMGDPQVVAQAYGIPNNPTGAGFGLASGGLPPEGMLYGDSFGYILGQLLALQTAGFNNVNYSGPQIGLIGAPVWDRWITGYLSSLTPTAKVFAAAPWAGAVFQMAGYGDMLRLWATPDFMQPPALLALLEQQTGSSTHVNAARWFAESVMPDGMSGLLARISNPWTWGVTQDLLYFMLLDPAASAATDPRSGFPTLFYDAPAARIVAHSDWTAGGTEFDYRASWISINHQDGGAGEFGFFRQGEWLTKEMSNYDNGGLGNGATVTFHNTLGLQNWCAGCATINWQGPDHAAYINGSQWMEGGSAGDPATTMSSGPGYVYAASDLTNLYNKPNNFIAANSIVNITQATRSILWLNNDYIVVYDRATSLNAGLFKRFNLSLVASPFISGNVVADRLPSGQQLFVQALLPLNPSLTYFSGVAALNPLAELEPTRFIYQAQDPGNPADTRFLHVLQGADAGAPMVAANYLQSTAGTAFDGAQFGGSEVWFPVSGTGVFGGATLPVLAGVHSVLIAGLAPGGTYTTSTQPSGSGLAVSVYPAVSGGATADAGGVLQLSF